MLSSIELRHSIDLVEKEILSREDFFSNIKVIPKYIRTDLSLIKQAGQLAKYGLSLRKFLTVINHEFPELTDMGTYHRLSNLEYSNYMNNAELVPSNEFASGLGYGNR